MSPTIVLIRHAQALHNIDNKFFPSQFGMDYSIHDPPLSDLGVEQCVALRRQLQTAFADVTTNVEHVAVIVSPMRRTMQTAMLSLDWLVDRGVKFEANADWQENSDKPCDTGSPISSLTGDFPHVNFSNVDSVWPDKTSTAARRYAHTRRDILNRGRYGLEALKERPEKLIFVVSHSGFLRVGVVGYWFFNSDYRIFDFDQEAGGLNLKQQKSTIAGGMGLSWIEPVALGSELPDGDDTN